MAVAEMVDFLFREPHFATYCFSIRIADITATPGNPFAWKLTVVDSFQADYDKSILKKPEEKVVTSRTLSSTEAAASIFWEVKDNCQPENRTTCEPNQCCVKEILAYLPDYKGKRAAFRLMCRNLLTEGEFCIPNDADHICPCMDGLRCRAPADLDYGHCTKI